MWPPLTVRPAQVALGEIDDGRRRHALQATLWGCDRAARLVDQLLTRARLEAAELPVLGDVDPGDLVRQVVADLAPAAMRKQQTLELDAAEGCIVGGDATLLAVLVRNLVDNAIRYSPADATLKMAVAKSAGSVVLQVDDSGPGLRDEDLKRMGERFFRVLGSAEAGSGLGWSIVRRIAAVQRAELRVFRSKLLGGLAVEVEWLR